MYNNSIGRQWKCIVTYPVAAMLLFIAKHDWQMQNIIVGSANTTSEMLKL